MTQKIDRGSVYGPSLPRPARADQVSDLSALRAQMLQMQKDYAARMAALEKRLAKAEAEAKAAKQRPRPPRPPPKARRPPPSDGGQAGRGPARCRAASGSDCCDSAEPPRPNSTRDQTCNHGRAATGTAARLRPHRNNAFNPGIAAVLNGFYRGVARPATAAHRRLCAPAMNRPAAARLLARRIRSLASPPTSIPSVGLPRFLDPGRQHAVGRRGLHPDQGPALRLYHQGGPLPLRHRLSQRAPCARLVVLRRAAALSRLPQHAIWRRWRAGALAGADRSVPGVRRARRSAATPIPAAGARNNGVGHLDRLRPHRRRHQRQSVPGWRRSPTCTRDADESRHATAISSPATDDLGIAQLRLQMGAGRQSDREQSHARRANVLRPRGRHFQRRCRSRRTASAGTPRASTVHAALERRACAMPG